MPTKKAPDANAPETVTGRVAKSRPVSLLPHHDTHAEAQMRALGIGFSRYLQILIEADKGSDIARGHLMDQLSQKGGRPMRRARQHANRSHAAAVANFTEGRQ